MVIIFWGMIYDYIAIAALIYIVENVSSYLFYISIIKSGDINNPRYFL